MTDITEFTDEFGPLKIIHVYEPSVDLRAVLVVDNVAAGPSIGGLRMAPDVTVEECRRLARAMTYKNAAAGLRHGGGKSVMIGDPAMPRERKEAMIRAFACALRGEDMYIFGPDMGTDEQCMAWVHDEIGRAVGLPRAQGGIPLDELGATGFGCAHAADVATAYCDLKLDGARIAIQGFGNVGMHAARFLAARGGVLVAAGDSKATLHDPAGLDVDALIALKKGGGSVADLGGGHVLDRDAVIGVDCDILIPAARPDVITEANVDSVKAKLIVEGANIPATRGAEKILHERGQLVLPDFIANAGGVICAAMEYAKASETAAFLAIEEKIRANMTEVLDMVKAEGILPRQAARRMAEARVRRAMENRRWTLF